MQRRTFFSGVAGFLATIAGCWPKGTQPEPVEDGYVDDLRRSFKSHREMMTEPTPLNPIDRVSRRLEIAMTGDGVSFDPITLSILASIICGIVRYCMANAASRIQKQIQRRPDGQAAVRLRGKLTTQFRDGQASRDVVLFPDQNDVPKHVDAAMSALITATPKEFESLVNDLKNDSSSFDGRDQATARDWSRLE